MRRATGCAAVAMVALAGGVAVSQASGAGAGAAKARTVKLAADPGGALKFTKTTVRSRAGRVTVALRNPGSSGVPHAVEVEGKGQEKQSRVGQPGTTVRVTLNLKKGRYKLYCPVDGHKRAGMTGTLIVS